MDKNEFQKLLEKLQVTGLIKHPVIMKSEHWYSLRKGIGLFSMFWGRFGRIYCYPSVLKYVNENQLIFILLHEEGHCLGLRDEKKASDYAEQVMKLYFPELDLFEIMESIDRVVANYRMIEINAFQKKFLQIYWKFS